MRIVAVLSIAGMLTLSGCSEMSKSDRRLLTGAALGAATGALVAGDAGAGALVGTGVGLAGGYLYDQHRKSEGN